MVAQMVMKSQGAFVHYWQKHMRTDLEKSHSGTCGPPRLFNFYIFTLYLHVPSLSAFRVWITGEMKDFNSWLQRQKMVARIVVQECTTVLCKAASYIKMIMCTWVYVALVSGLMTILLTEKKQKRLARATLIVLIKSTIVMATTVTGREAVLAALSLQQPTECNFPSSLPYECH